MTSNNLKQFIAITCFSLLGIAGNLLHFPLFFGVDFIFGSIAVLMAIRITGLRGAIIVALISGAYTYIIWGHPYAMIIFTVEAVIVSWLLSRKTDSIILADLAFWIVVGMPLIWIFYSGIMGMPQTQTLLILFKQPVNGVTNALIVTFILFAIPVKTLFSYENKGFEKIRLKELVFSTLLVVSLTSTLILFIYENNIIRDNYESSLKNEIEIYASFVEHHVSETGLIDISALESDYHLKKYSKSVIFIDDKENIITSNFSEEIQNDFINTGNHSTLDNGLSLWKPQRNELPFMLWWKQAYYYLQFPLPAPIGGEVILLQSSKKIINNLQTDSAHAFQALFVLILISGIVSYFVSEMLSSTIIKLANATKNISEKLKNNTEIEWPESNVSELSILSTQAKLMSDNIEQTFSDANIHSTTIVENSIDAIITIDSNGKIASVNAACEEMFGYSRAELVNEAFCRLISEDQRVHFETICNNFHTGVDAMENKTRRESIGLNKNGEPFSIEFSISVIKLRNKNLFACIISDIRERKASEKLKKDFISTVSHELRTPLTSIKGAVKLIQARKEIANKEETDNMLNLAERNVARLSDLINDLLDFEKLDSEGIQYDIQIIEIANCISSLIEENLPMAQQGGVKITSTVIENQCIKADPARLDQVIRNFISNAIKFTPEGSSIEIGSHLKNNSIKIYVKDKGAGIPESFKPYIFQRFAQADSSDTKKIQRGTGLGCSGIVNLAT